MVKISLTERKCIHKHRERLGRAEDVRLVFTPNAIRLVLCINSWGETFSEKWQLPRWVKTILEQLHSILPLQLFWAVFPHSFIYISPFLHTHLFFSPRFYSLRKWKCFYHKAISKIQSDFISIVMKFIHEGKGSSSIQYLVHPGRQL